MREAGGGRREGSISQQYKLCEDRLQVTVRPGYRVVGPSADIIFSSGERSLYCICFPSPRARYYTLVLTNFLVAQMGLQLLKLGLNYDGN